MSDGPAKPESPDGRPVWDGRGENPLAGLRVFDRLEVGPVRLTAKSLTAPYRLVWPGGASEATALTYTFEEPVFDPQAPADQNLAALVAAQAALNYGLFVRQLVFHGRFDEADRRFLREMAENTAREIYVKKFLEPNPFLVGPAARLPVVRAKRYLEARLKFVEPPGGAGGVAWESWEPDPAACAVLSSGGKESLLSYGLLRELGRRVHPVFINESGRHWYTAVNAYRHFQAHEPRTARVWVDCDRLFNWVLRRMPFIRPDFAEVRADIYPIRLWTVAVFLFGALPLLRRHRVGRLVIGDEHDTTLRAATAGIPHYDGLFDQSRFFDAALSRYFMRKGWGVAQFSILRPLSELLVQKVLVERYPELQALQVSCHAAHAEGERMRPCGRCEKCRRVVGMLTSLGADPGHCGYRPEQVAAGLAELARKGVKQESEGFAQMLAMLAERGALTLSEGATPPRPHPEILQLRFHPVRSPVDGIPLDLRRELYRLLARHTAGAVKWAGRRWQPWEEARDPDLNRPFAFETAPPEAGGGPGSAEDEEGERYLWGELTWPDLQERLQKVDVALLPVGALEQHGPHLPLDTDAFDADYLARRVAEACTPPRPLVLPLVPYGVSYHHEGFAGTVSLGNETLSRLVYEVGLGAARHGVRKLVIINGHGGNSPALNYAAQMINRDAGIFVCVDTGETSDVDVTRLAETANDVHAGEIETSTSLAVRPHLVRLERAAACVPAFSSRYLDFSSRRGVAWYAFTKQISACGVMGDPSKASAEKGRRMWEVMRAHLVGLVEDLRSLTLEEIHQRQY